MLFLLGLSQTRTAQIFDQSIHQLRSMDWRDELYIITINELLVDPSISSEEKKKIQDALFKIRLSKQLDEKTAEAEKVITAAAKKYKDRVDKERNSVPNEELSIFKFEREEFLSKRTSTALYKGNVHVVGDILSRDINTLSNIDGIGKNGLEEIINLVHSLGYKLEGEESVTIEKEQYRAKQKIEKIDNKIMKLKEQLSQLEQLKNSIKNGENNVDSDVPKM